MEKLNGPSRQQPGVKMQVDWTPYWIGWVSGIIPWVVIAIYFIGSAVYADGTSKVPSFVYAIIVSYFIFFNTFPLNMYLQYAKVGPWKDYRYGELWYLVLSLASKSLLAWLVVANAFQPDGKDEN